MMTGIVGDRGVGKTAYLSERIHEFKNAGYFIITNFTHADSNIDASRMSPRQFYQLLSEIGEFKDSGYELCDLFPSFKHTGVFVGIDEIQLYFDEHFKKEPAQIQKTLLKLLAQARKLDVQIYFVAQQPDKVNKDFRRFTEEWIRLRPFMRWRTMKPVPHPTRPCVQYEMRYWVPLIWEEHHKLSAENPEFNYAVIRDPEALTSSWAPRSTISYRRLRLSGWARPFPYKLYRSMQPLAFEKGELKKNQTFPLLRNFDLVESGMEREIAPTLKKIIRACLGFIGLKKLSKHPAFRDTDATLPKRYRMTPELVQLPRLESEEERMKNILDQPIKKIENLGDLRSTQFRRFLSDFMPPSSPL